MAHGAGNRVRDALVGAASVLVVYGAVPAVLVGLVGAPVPAHWSEAELVSWRGLFDLLTVVAWGAWLACAWPLLRAVVSRVRRRDVTAHVPAGLADRLALRIAAGVLALSPAALSTVAAAAGSPPRAVVAAAAPVVSVPGGPTVSAAPAAPPPAPATVTVEAGDSLWGIAAACYGDPGDWPAIAAANLGHAMADGSRFVDPSLIRPGWVLVVPPLDASTTAAVQPATPPAVPAASDPPVAPRRRVGRSQPADPRSVRPYRTARLGTTSPPSPGLPTPALAAMGMGALVAGLCARRMRTTRRWRSLARTTGERWPAPSDAAADLATALGPFERLPLVELVEQAARDLGAALGTAPSDPPAPVRLMRAGPDGVEVRFGADHPAPAGWEPAGHGAWLLPAAAAADPVRLGERDGAHDPWCPVLLPVGEDDRGTWLVPLHPGDCLAVLGVAAGELVAAMRVAQACWTWHDSVTVTDDPAVVASAARNRREGGGAILFVGDPAALGDPALAACAVLTTRAWAPAPVTLVVDRGAVTVHPLGMALRPHLLAPETVGALAELDRPGTGTVPTRAAAPGPSATQSHQLGPGASPEPPPGTLDDLPAPGALDDLPPPGARDDLPAPGALDDVPAPGPVCVRLLTPVPRIDGLTAPISPKRARRAVELVAYLALHHPRPVTGDRLRTRVLGSADVDAAAKTLFNTAGAARAALGTDPEGISLLPPATRDGRYRISPLVTLDAVRAGALLRAGLDAVEHDTAMALLREGLAQIDGEPLAGMLTGYAWWRAEGHERRLADAVTDGACRLVRLALGAGHADLARWALEQARLIEPYSELLSRAAMETAASCGDTRRLQLEWAACQRQVDEIDPGGYPSEATERLYARLRRQLQSGEPASIGG